MPQTVPVGEQVPGLNPSGRWINAVDITRIRIQDRRPMRGGETTVELRFTNRTGEPLTIRESVEANGEVVAEVVTEIAPDSATTERVRVTVPDAETLTVSCAGDSHQRETTDWLKGENISISPDPPVRNRRADVTVSFENPLSRPVSRTLPVTVNGTRKGERALSLGPGEKTEMSVPVLVGSQRRLEVDIGPESMSWSTMAPGAGGSSPGPSPDPSEPGDKPDTNTSLNPMKWVESLASTLGVSKTVAMGGAAAAVVVLGVLVL